MAETEPKIPEGEHPLQTGWAFWYEKKRGPQRKKDMTKEDWEKNLVKLGTFYTIEGFWRFYVHLKRPKCMAKDTNVYLFREGYTPMWESFPTGGCWILKVKKTSGVLTKLWQDLLFGVIGESFAEPGLVGVALAVRSREDLMSVWNGSNENPNVRFKIGDRLRKTLKLEDGNMIEYKQHKHSLVDKSTYGNAEQFVFQATEKKEKGMLFF
eukprot:TRINITY_DN4616_c0_g1_i1.p1 TRINITY_DN4616_c0_g1~~TRINITY_DN4616_c0_g1_i1.p1  ORF type:complete len:210 (+),score=48.03 TRINITY_DN4616_c0_g1_i1:34-663(+)